MSEFEGIHSQLGRLVGAVEGMRDRQAELNGLIAEHLRADDAAHRAQDDRIAALKAEVAEERGARAASVRWCAAVTGFLGLLIGAISGLAQHFLRT